MGKGIRAAGSAVTGRKKKKKSDGMMSSVGGSIGKKMARGENKMGPGWAKKKSKSPDMGTFGSMKTIPGGGRRMMSAVGGSRGKSLGSGGYSKGKSAGSGSYSKNRRSATSRSSHSY